MIKAFLKKDVLRDHLNVSALFESLMELGNMFHSLGPATLKALSPYVFSDYVKECIIRATLSSTPGLCHLKIYRLRGAL